MINVNNKLLSLGTTKTNPTSNQWIFNGDSTELYKNSTLKNNFFMSTYKNCSYKVNNQAGMHARYQWIYPGGSTEHFRVEVAILQHV